jgi:hypothetical protein
LEPIRIAALDELVEITEANYTKAEKTYLVKRLAEKIGARLVLEPEERSTPTRIPREVRRFPAVSAHPCTRKPPQGFGQ